MPSRVFYSRLQDPGGQFVTGGTGIYWQGLKLVCDNISRYGDGVIIGARAASRRLAQEMETYAKENAPWRDVSGAARDGLKAVATEDTYNFIINLGHSVPYGVWLETRNSGRTAIILPTLYYFADKAIAEVVRSKTVVF